MSRIIARIDADGTGFQRTMTQVQGRVAKLSGSLNSSFKGNLASFFGAAAIGAAIHNMVDFATEIEHASKRLGIATDKIQELRATARHAGKDLDVFSGVFRSIEKSAAAALGGDSKKANIFKRLGISDDELKHLNKANLLSKLMKGTAGLDRTQAEQLLNGVAGPKNGGSLMAMREDLANPDGLNVNKIPAEDLAALAESRARWLDIVDTLRTGLIPALITVSSWIADFGHNLMQGFKVAFSYVSGLIENIKGVSVTGGLKGAGKAALDTQAAPFKEGWKLITGKQGLGETFNNIWDTFANGGKEVLTGFFGNDAVKAAEDAATTMGEVTAQEDKERQARIQKAIDDAKAEQARLAGPVNRAAAPKGDSKDKSLLDKELKASNEYLKIGGLMGTDAAYRLARLSQETNNLLKQIVKNTTPAPAESDPEEGGDVGP